MITYQCDICSLVSHKAGSTIRSVGHYCVKDEHALKIHSNVSDVCHKCGIALEEYIRDLERKFAQRLRRRVEKMKSPASEKEAFRKALTGANFSDHKLDEGK